MLGSLLLAQSGLRLMVCRDASVPAVWWARARFTAVGTVRTSSNGVFHPKPLTLNAKTLNPSVSTLYVWHLLYMYESYVYIYLLSMYTFCLCLPSVYV